MIVRANIVVYDGTTTTIQKLLVELTPPIIAIIDSGKINPRPCTGSILIVKQSTSRNYALIIGTDNKAYYSYIDSSGTLHGWYRLTGTAV